MAASGTQPTCNMKISDRITLNFSITVMAVVTGLGLSLYFFTVFFHRNEFYTRLEERVQLAERILLENNQAVEQAVRDRFLQRLDEEVEYAITLAPSGLDSLDRLFCQPISKEIKPMKFHRFWCQNRQGIARKYSLPLGEYVVVVTAVDVFGQTKLRFLRQILAIGVFMGALVLVLVGRFSTRRVLQPLENKIQKAKLISAHRFDLRLEVENPDDELGELALAFNSMLDRLQASFEAQKHFVGYASHEIRNPLTAIIGECEVLLQKPRSGDEYRDALQVISQEAERLELLTKQLLELAKAESLASLPSSELFSLDLCLLEVAAKFPSKRLSMRISTLEEQCYVNGNPHLLFTALLNLVDNALKYSGEQKVNLELLDHRDTLEIVITDGGIGIPSEDFPNIFLPLQRSRNARGIRGHGIGLPLAQKIVQLHHGSLEVSSKEGAGTTVRVKLAKAKSPSA